MLFRVVSAVMALLFAFAAVVQLNDPDPLRWVLVYALAAFLAFRAVSPRPLPSYWPPVVLAVVAGSWSTLLGARAFQSVAVSEMFQAWEMRSPAIEEARESSGLLIVAGWMAVLAIRAFRTTGDDGAAR